MRRLLAVAGVLGGLLAAGGAEAATYAETRELVVAASVDGAFRCAGVDRTLFSLLIAAELTEDAELRCLILHAALHCVTRTSRTGLPSPGLANPRAVFLFAGEPWAVLIETALMELHDDACEAHEG